MTFKFFKQKIRSFLKERVICSFFYRLSRFKSFLVEYTRKRVILSIGLIYRIGKLVEVNNSPPTKATILTKGLKR